MSNLTSLQPIAVRVLGEADRETLIDLAGRDSASAPTGAVLGAEVEGTLVAAISLTTGASVSDPFRASGPALELLELRAHQLSHGARRRLPRRRSRADARAGFAGSPAGAEGRLLRR